ncbi:hypothetical protein J6590_020277 [Homalodisca vitripennis]|nr:hypothetical protein J6590_020277 [Homalodisca vitripennis]
MPDRCGRCSVLCYIVPQMGHRSSPLCQAAMGSATISRSRFMIHGRHEAINCLMWASDVWYSTGLRARAGLRTDRLVATSSGKQKDNVTAYRLVATSSATEIEYETGSYILRQTEENVTAY